MSTILLAATIRLSIWAALIAQIVFCNDVNCRMLWGGGSLLVVAPVMIWQATRQATKIGYRRCEADLVLKHIQMCDHED